MYILVLAVKISDILFLDTFYIIILDKIFHTKISATLLKCVPKVNLRQQILKWTEKTPVKMIVSLHLQGFTDSSTRKINNTFNKSYQAISCPN